MSRDQGAVLINALVIVLVISAIAAALLTRAEGARVRAGAAQEAAQTALYLDGIEALVPGLLRAPIEIGVSHLGQPWASGAFTYDIDRGTVTARIRDLQGGLNVNWLVSPDDFERASFARLFAEVDVPVTMVDAIADFLQPGGSERVNSYLARTPPLRPRGGAIRVLAQLREVEGMTPLFYERLEPYLAALPVDARVNLNTAPGPVLRAVLAAFPPELAAETLARGVGEPMDGLRVFRNRLIEILGTEDIGDYPVDRLTTGSDWFGVRLTARLENKVSTRQVVFQRVFTPEPMLAFANRWAEYD